MRIGSRTCPEPPRAPNPERPAMSKSYSCLPCRQRKVKCDRQTPCSNCIKAEKQCSFIAPVRGKRKKTKPLKEGLHAKLKRYEELLRSYGALVEPSENSVNSDTDTILHSDNGILEEVERSTKEKQHFRSEESEAKLITQGGSSRYFDSAPWSNVGVADDFEHPEIAGPDEPIEQWKTDDGGLLLGLGPSDNLDNIRYLHPPLPVLIQLREIYIDRVSPLISILHLATFWAALTSALDDPQPLPKSLEALAFSFYFAAISTSKKEECEDIFGAPTSIVSSRYQAAARQALVNAAFLSTSSLMTLQAFAIFIICVRDSYSCETLFIFSGVAIRLARKMGLHRDGSSLGLSVFETEMRRRIWWNLVHMDFRTAEVLGTRPSLDLACGNTKLPLNIEDEDIHPNMADPPLERNGITCITPCLIKCEILECLRKLSTAHFGETRWDALSSPDVKLTKKDITISRIEDHLEAKYLRYCDPSSTLDTFVSIMIRSIVCRMKLFAHNPRHFAKSPSEVPISERNIVFTNATKLLEYVLLLKSGHNGIDRYMWLGMTFLWNSMLYLLIEVRYRKTGPEVDSSWKLIGTVFSHFPEVFEENPGSVYRALGNWTLEVWDGYIAASKAEELPEPPTPEYIHLIRQCRKVKRESHLGIELHTDSAVATQKFLDQEKTLSPTYNDHLPDVGSLESHDFPDLSSLEMDPNEWIQWEQLVAGHLAYS